MEKTDLALSKILNELADKFGTTVDHLYAIMIKQAYIDGIESILGAIICIVAILVALRLFKNHFESAKKERPNYIENWNDYFEEYVGITIVSCIVGLVLIILIPFACVNAINALANPEYYALHNLISGK